MSEVVDRNPAAPVSSDLTVGTTRTAAISLDQAWDAWTTPGGLWSWWCADAPDVTCSVDSRVGGECRIHSASSGLGARAAFVTIERPSRLVLRWRWLGDHRPTGEDLVQVRFVVDEEDVVVTVEHTVSDDAALEPCAARWGRLMDAFAGLGGDTQALVCPRCGHAVVGAPPVCTGRGCPLARQERWTADTVPVPLVDY
ncbi:SRPBCC family protein [Ruania halotolerans]|uniref:SRPBCC family protein n=1 Tax=Ruania halotolerans TaxID=2897773 RepID=UPI001E47EDEE|nr:SRPBCC domain-containing protein [Ruania halotolerans]UFU07539.1 SRPBCC domain-containing protein [Ruania halotolerans]